MGLHVPPDFKHHVVLRLQAAYLVVVHLSEPSGPFILILDEALGYRPIYSGHIATFRKLIGGVIIHQGNSGRPVRTGDVGYYHTA